MPQVGFELKIPVFERANTFRTLDPATTVLRHYATSRKVAGSIPDEVIEFFLGNLILPAAIWPRGRLSL
jgi:hypothetical protein